MLKSKSICTRLTLFMTILLSICCIILVLLFNYSISINLGEFTLLNPNLSNFEISIPATTLVHSLQLKSYLYLVLVVALGGVATWLYCVIFLILYGN